MELLEQPAPQAMMIWSVKSPDYIFPLRLCCQHLTSMGDSGLLKCVLQRVESGHPVAEHPLAVGFHDKKHLDSWISKREAHGWEFILEVPKDNKSVLHNLRLRRSYQDQIERRKCPRCPGDAAIGRRLCLSCQKKETIRKNKKRAERRMENARVSFE